MCDKKGGGHLLAEYVLMDFDGWIRWFVLRGKYYVDPLFEQEFISLDHR